jgi:hypothetical protein
MIALSLLAVATSPARAQRPSLSLEWLGHDADEVSRDETSEPDGITDLHFRLTIRPAGPATIRSITLWRAGNDGRPADDFGYGTADSTGTLLVVRRGGGIVNQGFATSLLDVEGETTLDLYARDFGTIDTGGDILVEVALDGRAALRRTVTLAPPAGRLLGAWNVHCDPRSAQAFEPMTLSGRLWLDLAADGGVAGSIDGVSVSGSVAGDSLRASGESPAGRASLSGELTRQRGRGARPKAAGTVDFQPTGESCTSGLWWTD